MPAVALWITAVVVVLLESALLGAVSVEIWALQTPLIVTIYIALDRDFVAAGLMVAALFVPVEWVIGGIEGAYSLGLAAVFLFLQAIRSNLQPDWGIARGVAAAIAAVVHGLVVMVAAAATAGGQTGLTSAVAWQLWWTAPTVGIGVVVAGKVFARVDEMLDPRGGRRGLEHDP